MVGFKRGRSDRRIDIPFKFDGIQSSVSYTVD